MNEFSLHREPGLNWLGVVVLTLFTAYAVSQTGATRHPSLTKWISILVRVLTSWQFPWGLADRFSLRGPRGQDGVSWGDYGAYIDYTRQVATFLPGGLRRYSRTRQQQRNSWSVSHSC
ncbi:hypothetical protein LWC34_09570 [Kibdelosporangium philippinense]|uniref:Uncharacterized protein n=1 Tax=Kibdelosporangium philippinense TaxID=211113 RepID=A0ABS8Z5A5_9PSEU|nr:hypothetical protein [Kibdelosporangium philippinense]MCE7003074.1 hypothetical protein [Kibdelosporangium philippinense]